jgi:hypothetical protein
MSPGEMRKIYGKQSYERGRAGRSTNNRAHHHTGGQWRRFSLDAIAQTQAATLGNELEQPGTNFARQRQSQSPSHYANGTRQRGIKLIHRPSAEAYLKSLIDSKEITAITPQKNPPRSVRGKTRRKYQLYEDILPQPFGAVKFSRTQRRDLTFTPFGDTSDFPANLRQTAIRPSVMIKGESFSVFDGGTRWKDFAIDEAGDAVDFFQRATGLSQKDACRKFIELAGGHITPAPRAARPQCKPASAKLKPAFPDFIKGTVEDLKQLANLRNISLEGMESASERGLLWFARLKDRSAWIVTDSSRVNAQARRMDGQQWEHIGAKAWTLPGAWASWPIGLTESQPFPAIALCEGGPDLLAACHFIACESRQAHCSPVAMLGASQRIHPDALPTVHRQARSPPRP